MLNALTYKSILFKEITFFMNQYSVQINYILFTNTWQIKSVPMTYKHTQAYKQAHTYSLSLSLSQTTLMFLLTTIIGS
jgi:hypothetical protein